MHVAPFLKPQFKIESIECLLNAQLLIVAKNLHPWENNPKVAVSALQGQKPNG